MKGLDLETFLRLIEAPPGTWVGAGLVGGVAFLAFWWAGWGSRRALRRCLVVSVAAHLAIVSVTAKTEPATRRPRRESTTGIREIRVNAVPSPRKSPSGEDRSQLARAEVRRGLDLPGLATVPRSPLRLSPPGGISVLNPDLPLERMAGTIGTEHVPSVTPPNLTIDAPPGNASVETPAGVNEPEAPTAAPSLSGERERVEVADPADEPNASKEGLRRSASIRLPDPDLRLRPKEPDSSLGHRSPTRFSDSLGPPRLATRPPLGIRVGSASNPLLASLSPTDVPLVYRSRLDPNRSVVAVGRGATRASEEAVERALIWLSRHQDQDGRWNGGTQKTRDERIAAGETSYTMHCPPGEICAGECHYHEADTAMTGLALLAYLGAGYTHREGKHAEAVARGIGFLLRCQTSDGDLRGDSRAVGMYCHAIASLALGEVLAITRDETLRGPVERAVGFIERSRAADGLAWRYVPGDRSGSDTSILGWIVLALKAASEAGIEVPASCRTGSLNWLNRVARGAERGLAIYGQTTESGDGLDVSPTMTAEAWVCRQFLGAGGPGRSSDEAAAYLLTHLPSKDTYNLYYWYYGTLAMHQHGGRDWEEWNRTVRDAVVQLQSRSGHADGSWDPQLSQGRYDSKGGRIYSTALATLTLEVYYRYLRFHERSPGSVPSDAGTNRPEPGRDRGDRNDANSP